MRSCRVSLHLRRQSPCRQPGGGGNQAGSMTGTDPIDLSALACGTSAGNMTDMICESVQGTNPLASCQILANEVCPHVHKIKVQDNRRFNEISISLICK